MKKMFLHVHGRWGELNIVAGKGKKYQDHEIMYAAGFLEGALTARYSMITSES